MYKFGDLLNHGYNYTQNCRTRIPVRTTLRLSRDRLIQIYLSGQRDDTYQLEIINGKKRFWRIYLFS